MNLQYNLMNFVILKKMKYVKFVKKIIIWVNKNFVKIMIVINLK